MHASGRRTFHDALPGSCWGSQASFAEHCGRWNQTPYCYFLFPRQTESVILLVLVRVVTRVEFYSVRARRVQSRPCFIKRNKSMSIRAAMALACIGTTVYAATDTSSLNPWLADMEYSVRGEVRCFCMSARGIKRMCRSIVLHYIPAKMYTHILSVATAAVPCK